MIMAGGTGGHVFPGLAVAEVLRRQGVAVVWLGTRQGLEDRLVPDSGIELECITIQGLRRRGLWSWLTVPFRLLLAMWQALRVLRRRRPDAVLAMGGFVAGPGALVAWLLRRPLLIHEQNAIPGLTNRILSVFARRVLCGFPGAFAGLPGTRIVGNPVRPEIARLPAPEARLRGREGRLRLLVVGGSQGARVFNERVPEAVLAMSAETRPQIRHQSGLKWVDETTGVYAEMATLVEVKAFIDDMAAAYAWADLVICRSGAMTVAELAAAGLASILVPYPYAVDDHQTANARFLADRDAAILLPEPEFAAARLGELLEEFAANREVLLRMAVNARGCATPDAAESVASLCMEAANA